MIVRVSVLYQRDITHFVSDDDYRTGCRNVSHSQQQFTQDYDHQDDHIPPTYEDPQCNWFVNGDRTRERSLCNPALS